MNNQEVFDQAADASAVLNDSKRRARDAARHAIAGMMAALSDALENSTLRGLPNLAGSTHPYRGVRVRVKKQRHLSAPLPRPRGDHHGAWTLCINIRGKLVFARWETDGHVAERDYAQTDLVAEDAIKLANSIAELLAKHIEKAERGTERYDRMRSWSERFTNFLKENPR